MTWWLNPVPMDMMIPAIAAKSKFQLISAANPSSIMISDNEVSTIGIAMSNRLYFA